MPRDKAKKTLAVIGQGYVGLPLAMAAVKAGWNVIGVDLSASKVAAINNGSSPVEDIQNSQLESAISMGKYLATTDFSHVSSASVVTICVPTPLDSHREPDTTLLESAAKSIAPFLESQTLVVSESTSYPGTLRNVIIPIIEQAKKLEVNDLFFACAPERVNPGDQRWSMQNTPRLVGGVDPEATDKAIKFYQTFCDEVVKVDSPEIAEAAKLLENTFRLVNIALINEFTKSCDAAKINVHKVIDAASSKPYGFMQFRPGVGVGGHCIPVDPLYLTWWSNSLGVSSELVLKSDQINLEMPEFVAKKVLGLISPEKLNPKVLILGVAYKPGVRDVRETPSKTLRDSLENQGAMVGWIDPLVDSWHGDKPVDYDWNCDVAVIATNQPGLNLDRLISRGVPILDCTNSHGRRDGVTLL